MSMDMWNPPIVFCATPKNKLRKSKIVRNSRFYSLPTTASGIELLQVSIFVPFFPAKSLILTLFERVSSLVLRVSAPESEFQIFGWVL